MSHLATTEDRSFRAQLESCALPKSEFDHRAHLRLAYVNLVDQDVESALERMRNSLQRYLESLGAEPGIYHETLTRAWMLAVQHFMRGCEDCGSFANFVARCPELLDTGTMLTHYSKGVLFSSEARASFVAPDLSPIPVLS